ncbi:YegS/Rv2252/BmrU family lipid kinase [Gramella sp. GC03-9]|uniref:YegS/Rv2252/BmrU family lipid kinase n=1 Tax=Christiangramia oceanisediminis TaxID=2920386 RepID=A0A9X2KXI6_9FLAO|nr:YegS/Rv2252/BmrU family lipid kinase [Gramella oceanisediminis]MCP9200071.1 YegS/Rv2252/BmrU family lipid kinase [Gramella oceanisediminis]
MNFKEVLLIVNPISGDIDKQRIINKVKEEVQRRNADFHLYRTTGENDIEKIRKFLDVHEIGRVLVAGGDGTINLVAETIRKYDLPMGIIPAGSANGLALNLELPDELNQQVKIAMGDNFINYDILSLNDTICLHMSDLGINAELIKNYENSNFRGKLGYLIQSIPTLIKSGYPFEFEIQSKGEDREAQAALLGIANANKYGTGANVNPIGRPDDGLFEILIFKRISLGEVLKTLRNETNLDPEFLEIIQTKSAKVICKKPVSFQIDGEYIGEETEIKISILPEKLKIAVPA